MVGEGLAEDLQPALEVAAEDPVLRVRGAQGATGVRDVRRAEETRGELPLALDQLLLVLALEHEADHDVLEQAIVEVRQYGAQGSATDLIEQSAVLHAFATVTG